MNLKKKNSEKTGHRNREWERRSKEKERERRKRQTETEKEKERVEMDRRRTLSSFWLSYCFIDHGQLGGGDTRL